MGFLNNKSRIVDITLTPKGVELLSKGILLPKYFTLHDEDVLYHSSSLDQHIEGFPILEAVSDICVNSQSYSSNPFTQNYVNIINNITGSLIIKRLTDENFDSDIILRSLLPNFIAGDPTAISPEQRIESLKSRGNIIDTDVSITIRRHNTDDNPLYLISAFMSSSDGKLYPMLVSGSTFGISNDNVENVRESNEYNDCNSFYGILRITQ